MTFDLPSCSEYFPFTAEPFRLSLGLRPLALADWIEIDCKYPDELSLKRRLLDQRHADVFAALPGSEAASAEVLELLAAHLATRFPDWFQNRGACLANRLTGETWNLSESARHPLDLAGRLVQEDLCVMQPLEGTYRLRAASVCFPSRWSLADKLNGTMEQIHAPVAFYRQQIGAPADRVIDVLSPERPLWRLNWSLHESPELFQSSGMDRSTPDATITPQNAPQRLWLRVERQTLRRLPATGAVLFTIRTHLRPLADLTSRPEVAARLAATLRNLPEATFRYKSYRVFADALLHWLDAVAASSLTPTDRGE